MSWPLPEEKVSNKKQTLAMDPENEFGLAKMLDLSTGHMPESHPDFGGYRHLEDDTSTVVYVAPLDEHDRECPEWLRPIMGVALAFDCILINFDPDGEVFDAFPHYEW